MSQDDDKNKKPKLLPEQLIDDESGRGTDEGSGGKGGKGGGIEFREFITSGERLRDDLLTGDEKRRLLSVHEGQHEGVVKKQKSTRDQRKQLKEGKVSLPAYRQGLASQGGSQYKSHPVLSQKAQFSGIDRQVNSLPTENVADTNQEKRDELQYQYNLVHRPENAPRFNPKPIQR